MKDNRQNVHEFYIGLAKQIASRGTCLRRQIGAVLIKDGIILATGYNGPPSGLAHCDKCFRITNNIQSSTRLEFCRAVHAEENVLIQCAIKQTNPTGGILYCTHSPCVTCAKSIIQAKISAIIYDEIYPDELTQQMIGESSVLFYQVKTPNLDTLLKLKGQTLI